MIILGIDPGISGGLAIVNGVVAGELTRIEAGIRMPTMQHRGKKLVDGKQMIEFLLRWDVDVMVCEWVHAGSRHRVPGET
jgi:hypothetical protein